MWQLIRVEFTDKTATSLWVGEDESIQDVVVALCEREGWDTSTVTNIVVERTEEDPE